MLTFDEFRKQTGAGDERFARDTSIQMAYLDYVMQTAPDYPSALRFDYIKNAHQKNYIQVVAQRFSRVRTVLFQTMPAFKQHPATKEIAEQVETYMNSMDGQSQGGRNSGF